MRGRSKLGEDTSSGEGGTTAGAGSQEMGAVPSFRGLSEQTYRLQLLLGGFGQLGQVQAVNEVGDGNGKEGRAQT